MKKTNCCIYWPRIFLRYTLFLHVHWWLNKQVTKLFCSAYEVCKDNVLPSVAIFITPCFLHNLQNGPTKLKCYISQGWKGFARNNPSSLLGPFVSFNEMNGCEYCPWIFLRYTLFLHVPWWLNKQVNKLFCSAYLACGDNVLAIRSHLNHFLKFMRFYAQAIFLKEC